MEIKKFNSLLKKFQPTFLLEQYMTGKYGTLTDNQLQKIIDKKDENSKGHGAIIFSYKKRGSAK